MAGVVIREGGAIPHKQIAALYAALGRQEEDARLDGRLAELLVNAAFVVSAWDEAHLVGAARVVSDRVAVALLQQVGVHPDYREPGIGDEVVARYLARFPGLQFVVLLDAPADAKHVTIRKACISDGVSQL